MPRLRWTLSARDDTASGAVHRWRRPGLVCGFRSRRRRSFTGAAAGGRRRGEDRRQRKIDSGADNLLSRRTGWTGMPSLCTGSDLTTGQRSGLHQSMRRILHLHRDRRNPDRPHLRCNPLHRQLQRSRSREDSLRRTFDLRRFRNRQGQGSGQCSCCASQLCGCPSDSPTNIEISALNQQQRDRGITPQCDVNGTLCGTP